MPIMPNGNFVALDALEAHIKTTRGVSDAIIRMARKRGLKNSPAVADAKLDLKRIEKLERDYLL